KQDFAECLRYLVEERYPAAPYVRLALDNLNIHVPAALYEAFSPERARAIVERLELHYTPKHGSWLSRTQIESSVFERGCLSRPVADPDHLATARGRPGSLAQRCAGDHSVAVHLPPGAHHADRSLSGQTNLTGLSTSPESGIGQPQEAIPAPSLSQTLE